MKRKSEMRRKISLKICKVESNNTMKMFENHTSFLLKRRVIKRI